MPHSLKVPATEGEHFHKFPFPYDNSLFQKLDLLVNPLNANPTKWSKTLKQFVDCCRRIILVCLTILWSWRLRVKSPQILSIN